MKKGKYAILLFSLLLSWSLGWASCPADTVSAPGKRPKVGVVLAGGGAKGYAHLGALQVMEQAGIHIDYIGGTSIGAIVGGLYAAGWTTGQIDSLITNFDMMNAVQDKVDRRYRLYYDKQTEGKVWFRLGIADGKLQFPSAISRGQNIINLFADWTIPVHDVTDFDSLYIPYFAMVTDLSTGESVKRDKGYLPEAMRASGTFPSLLSPFKIDTCTYVDGGVLDNYPVDRMRAMGADIIIGVNIGAGLMPPEKLNSIVSVLEQIMSFQLVKNTEVQRPHVDLEITPDIEKFGVMSFNLADTIYQRGVQAANRHLDVLEKIAELQKGYNIPVRTRPVEHIPDRFFIEDIVVEGSTVYPKDYFESRLKKDLPASLSLEDIHQAISRLYATGNFDNVYYRLREGSSDGKYKLHFIARENPAHRYVGLGWSYDNLYGINVLLNFRSTDVMRHLFRRTVFEADLSLGMSPQLNISLFRDNGSRPSMGANIQIGRLKSQTTLHDVIDEEGEPLPFRVHSDVVTDYVQGNIFSQITLNQRYTAGLGVEYLYMKSWIDNFTFSDFGSPRFENAYYFAPNLYVSGDTRDDKFFPTRGSYFNAMYKVLLTPSGQREDPLSDPPSRYEDPGGGLQSLLTIQYDQSIRLSKRFSLGVEGYAGLAFTPQLPFAYRFFPGGIRASMPFNYVQFYGLPYLWNSEETTLDLGQNNLMKVGLRLQYSPWRNNYVMAGYNFGWTAESGSAFEATYRRIQGGALGYGINTPLGRFQIVGTYSPDKHTGSNCALFFSAGFTF